VGLFGSEQPVDPSIVTAAKNATTIRKIGERHGRSKKP
jgi:hypothetical protein